MDGIVAGFFGVFSPKGKLEHVDGSEDAAKHTALAMSPKSGGAVRLNRTIQPVTILTLPFENALDQLFFIAMRQKIKQLEAILQEFESKPPSDWQERYQAQTRLDSAWKVYAALDEVFGST
jgi:hypothetical protein